MVKHLEHPEPGEHTEPYHTLGEGQHTPIPSGEPPASVELRRWSREMPVVRLSPSPHAPIADPCRRTSDDLYAVHLPEGSNAAEPRNDVSAEHDAPETPSDAVPDDAPLNDY